MELTIIGSASAAPNPGTASSCYLLDAGQGQLVLECGHGAAAKLLVHTSIDQVAAVLISHMHPDHFFDLVPLRYLLSFNAYPRLPLYIPPTGPKVLEGLAQVFGEDTNYWFKTYDIHVFDPNAILQVAGMNVSMSPSQHFIPAWGMRFEPGDSTSHFGYTSDTGLTDGVTSHLDGVHTLLAESSVANHQSEDGPSGHMSGGDAGLLAARVNAQTLVLTHYPHAIAEDLKRDAQKSFRGECGLAIEGDRYRI